MSRPEPGRTAFSRAVGAVQYVIAVATATTVVLLFSLGGRATTAGSSDPTSDPSRQIVLGESVYAADCAICHGRQGEGGTGPSLGRDLIEKYPDPPVEEALVTNGRNTMPGFGSRLSPTEITAVVLYTRTTLSAPSPS